MRAAYRWLATAVTLLMALPVGAAPAAADVAPQWAAVTGQLRGLVLAGDRYNISLSADDGLDDTNDGVMLTVERLRDPDGGGILRSRQQHRFVFDLGESMTTDTQTWTAAVDTGRQIAPRARITMAFTPDGGDPTFACDGGRETRSGALAGLLRINTSEAFGDIVIERMPAALTVATQDCPSTHGDPFLPQCIRATQGFLAQRGADFHVSATRPNRGAAATISAFHVRYLAMREAGDYGHVGRSITTRVPKDHVVVDPDLGRAVARGARGTDVRNAARFTANRAGQHDSWTCDWDDVQTQALRRGNVTGALVLDFFIGNDITLDGRTLRAHASRYRLQRS